MLDSPSSIRTFCILLILLGHLLFLFYKKKTPIEGVPSFSSSSSSQQAPYQRISH